MEALKTLLIANRGEIAVRIIKTAKAQNIRTISIYTEADAASAHVALADEAILLKGVESKAYIDGEQIVEVAKSKGANAIIPGYGFLSENSDFARLVTNSGMVFVGPSPESIESFGLKHTARELATKAGVPTVPGTKELVKNEEDAVEEAKKLGFPVMLKATAGGGGMGLLTCQSAEEVKESFKTVKSRGETLFKNPGMFVERFYPSSHHIEVQVFGNGLGRAIHFGERECSIQRRHQKVIEECPSPFVTKHPELRERLCSAAVALAESIRYGSAGTIEYLVDDESGDFFFLEMNTRLQVEHGITELCYGVDLVDLMLKQANAQLLGKGGLDSDYLSDLQPSKPNGAAIEVRCYAENPARNYAPSPGTLQSVSWKEMKGSRIDTWAKTGSKISSHYDPLIAKVMYHASTRDDVIHGMSTILSESRICGPPTNLDFLARILKDPIFVAGKTLTKFLETFQYAPPAIDVLAGGAYTLVEDWPGRPTIGRGFSHAGPMDNLSFRLANLLVGNPVGKEGLEITLSGPTLLFLGQALVSLTGAPMEAKLDDKPFPMWTRMKINAGQKLTIGKTTGGGCRSYLGVYGGFTNVAEWFGSKATAPMAAVGGYQGRALAAGDLLEITSHLPELGDEIRLPESLIPEYPSHWDILAMVGPYDVGYMLQEDIDMIYDTTWTISHNAARGGIRLIGPKPKWARSDGGEGGAHPSNVIEYGYPIGTLNWTGDDPCIFPVDCPDFGGFVSSTTIIKGDYWRLGQMKAGNTLRYWRVSLADALAVRQKVEDFIDRVAAVCKGGAKFESVSPLKYDEIVASVKYKSHEWGTAVVKNIEEGENQPLVSYRQGGDDYLLIDYGHGSFDINYTCRVTALIKELRSAKEGITFSNGLTGTVGCGNSLMLYYDGSKIRQPKLISYLSDIESKLHDLDLSHSKMPSRLFKLPITFKSKRQDAAIQRYMETQRPYASYLPDNMEFVAKNNAFTKKEVEDIFTTAPFLVIAVGFFTALPLGLPVDPRHRMSAPKMNPSRVFTPEGQASWGGSCLAIYNVESPGGYQLTGMTIPGVDILGSKTGYSASRPWLFEDFDQITFYEVTEEEYEKQMAIFHSGRYEYQWEQVEFDMKEHNKLLVDTKEQVKEIRKKQRRAQEEMNKLEKATMEKWTEEKKKNEISEDTIESLLNDPNIVPLEAPLNANVWKIQVEEGDEIKVDQVMSILEAMKLEIAVKAEESMVGGKVEKVLVRPGDVVSAGKTMVLVRRNE